MIPQGICGYQATGLNHGETKREGSATISTDGTALGTRTTRTTSQRGMAEQKL